MSKRPQFSLKALLVIIAVLAVPLAMMVHDADSLVEENLFAWGAFLALPVLFCCIGYLLGGWEGVLNGLLAALATMCIILLVFFFGVL